MPVNPHIRSGRNGEGRILLHHHGGTAELPAGPEILAVIERNRFGLAAREDREHPVGNGGSLLCFGLWKCEARPRANGGKAQVDEFDQSLGIMEIIDPRMRLVEGLRDAFDWPEAIHSRLSVTSISKLWPA